MKKTFIILIIALVFNPSCQKSQEIFPGEGKEIILGVEDGSMRAEVNYTKATPVTSLPSTLYWGATTGGNAGGSAAETTKWDAASFSVSSSQIATGKYQTASPTAYNHYVSNVAFTVGADTQVSASNATDVIVGRTAQSSSTTPSVTLNHIFARTGTLTMNTQSGYTISEVSWTIAANGGYSGTAGTYSLRQGAWTGVTTGLSSTAVTSSSDLFLIPGSYTITCSYRLTKGDWTNTFTKSATVNLVGGKINNITGTASGGSASEIVLSISLTAWSSQDHNLSFS